MAARANYTYKLFKDITATGTLHIFAITDHNRGGMSVTNDIENVLEEICSHHAGLKLTDCAVCYRDTDGRWDGWDTKTNDFISFKQGPPANNNHDAREFAVAQAIHHYRQ